VTLAKSPVTLALLRLLAPIQYLDRWRGEKYQGNLAEYSA